MGKYRWPTIGYRIEGYESEEVSLLWRFLDEKHYNIVQEFYDTFNVYFTRWEHVNWVIDKYPEIYFIYKLSGE